MPAVLRTGSTFRAAEIPAGSASSALFRAPELWRVAPAGNSGWEWGEPIPAWRALPGCLIPGQGSRFPRGAPVWQPGVCWRLFLQRRGAGGAGAEPCVSQEGCGKGEVLSERARAAVPAPPRYLGLPGAAAEPPRFAQCGRMGNNLSPMPAGTFLTSVPAAPGLRWGRSADELHPRCLCLLFGFALRCWVWFFLLPFPVLSFG